MLIANTTSMNILQIHAMQEVLTSMVTRELTCIMKKQPT